MQACKNALQEVQFFSTRMEQLEFALEQPENDTFELVSQARSLLDSLKLMENLPDYN